MLRHNLTIAFRNFVRFKSSFVINLVGLSSGLACTFLIYLWVNDELSVDKFNTKDERLFRAMEFRKRATGIWTAMSSPGPMADALVADFPEVEMAAQVTWPNSYTVSVGDNDFLVKGRYAAKDYFKMFSYTLIAGDSTSVITDKSSIAISDELAMTLFNSANCLGKTVELNHGEQFQVNGVFKKMPANASEQFDFVLPFEKYRENNRWLESWGNTGILTMVMVRPGVDHEVLNTKLADFIKVKTNNEIVYRTLFLKRYSEDYLYGNYDNGVLTGGRIMYVKLFSVIAIFILLIACVNFMNLSTARATRRMKEVGIKKTMGAARFSLISQYFSESLLMSFVSLIVAAALVYLFLPEFNQITQKHLQLQPAFNQVLWLLGITLFAGIVAGSYPALYLSGFQPAAILKGRLAAHVSEAFARKGLVVFQFSLSIIFIVSIIVVYRQIEFVQTTYIGYDKEHILYFNLSGALKKTETQELMISKVKQIPGVENASSLGHNMAGHNGGTWGVEWEGKDPEDRTEFERFMVNHDLIETLGMQLAEGRAFSRDFISDTTGIIFNERGIEFMGLKEPIGKTVKLWGTERKIIGVLKNFHYESLHESYKPLFMVLDPNETWNLMVRYAPGKESEVISALTSLHQALNPEFKFEYKFLDETYRAQYASEQRVAALSKYFGVLAILISCLGLFGLAAFTAERRVKEIGIRKVLGSGERAIVFLLAGDFTKIVLIAIGVALPISYFASQWWLSSFAFKAELQGWYFLAAGSLALIIAWLTVGYQAIKASRVNPTQCLKSE
jgi:putative ABC transport system permease protein